MKKKSIIIASIIFLVLCVIVILTGCGNSGSEHDNGIDTGVVTKSSRKSVTVLEDDGETDKHRVSRSIARKCSVGKRWPDCKR
jgi:hypothetical protein